MKIRSKSTKTKSFYLKLLSLLFQTFQKAEYNISNLESSTIFQTAEIVPNPLYKNLITKARLSLTHSLTLLSHAPKAKQSIFIQLKRKGKPASVHRPTPMAEWVGRWTADLVRITSLANDDGGA